jgi:hypothetical protein
VTTLALLIVKEGMLTTEGAVGEPFAMRIKGQIGTIEIVMTINAKLVFMTFVAELRISARRNRVGDGEVGAMNIGHGITELTHFICSTGFVTVETIILLMTSRAIDALGHGRVAVIQRPSRAVRHQSRELDGVNKGLIVALKANFVVRNNLL